MKRLVKLDVSPWDLTVVDEIFSSCGVFACFRKPEGQYCYYVQRSWDLCCYEGSLKEMHAKVSEKRCCEVINQDTPAVQIGQFRSLDRTYHAAFNSWGDDAFTNTKTLWSGCVVAIEDDYYLLITIFGPLFVKTISIFEAHPMCLLQIPVRSVSTSDCVANYTFEELLLYPNPSIREWARDHFAN